MTHFFLRGGKLYKKRRRMGKKKKIKIPKKKTPSAPIKLSVSRGRELPNEDSGRFRIDEAMDVLRAQVSSRAELGTLRQRQFDRNGTDGGTTGIPTSTTIEEVAFCPPQKQIIRRFRRGLSVNTKRTPILGAPSNDDLFSWLQILSNVPTKQRADFIRKKSEKFSSCMGFIRAVALIGHQTRKTQSGYFSHARRFQEFLHLTNPKKFAGKDIFSIVFEFDLGHETAAWILFIGKHGVAEGTIRKPLTVVNWLRTWVGRDVFTPKTSVPSQMVKSVIKFYALEPSSTKGFSWTLLREILLFLFKKDTKMFWVILLTFHCALRTGELIDLCKSDFKFKSAAWEDRKSVTIALRDTKTGKKRPRQVQNSYFVKPLKPEKNLRLPSGYAVCVKVFQQAKREDGRILPFPARQKSRGSLSNALSRWFLKFRKTFKKYIKAKKGWDVPMETWRFYAFRTTFCGLSLVWGVPLARVKQRMRHSPNSKVTENTYLLNCLMTPGFDEDFEKDFLRCPLDQKLFSKGGDHIRQDEINAEESFLAKNKTWEISEVLPSSAPSLEIPMVENVKKLSDLNNITLAPPIFDEEDSESSSVESPLPSQKIGVPNLPPLVFDEEDSDPIPVIFQQNSFDSPEQVIQNLVSTSNLEQSETEILESQKACASDPNEYIPSESDSESIEAPKISTSPIAKRTLFSYSKKKKAAFQVLENERQTTVQRRKNTVSSGTRNFKNLI